MRHHKQVNKLVFVQDILECDICHIKYNIGTVENESIRDYNRRVGEIQEFIHIYHSCGYNSIFGDETEYELDICQGCMSRLFGEIIKERSY